MLKEANGPWNAPRPAAQHSRVCRPSGHSGGPICLLGRRSEWPPSGDSPHPPAGKRPQHLLISPLHAEGLMLAENCFIIGLPKPRDSDSYNYSIRWLTNILYKGRKFQS